MNKARVGSLQIAYRIEPGAAPGRPWLVFSHSLAADHTMWAPQVAAFAAHFNVLRYDTRGHGASDVPAPPYTLEQLADDLRGLLDTVGIERCHFVGLSLGGMIGQMAALRHPRRFESLVLADTTSRYPAQMQPVWEERIAAVKGPHGMAAVAAATLERWFTASFRARDPDTVARIGAQIRATPVNGYIGCARAIMALNLTARLSAIAVPVLVVVGEDDAGTPPAMAEEIVRAIDGARLVRIAQAAHLSNLEQPQRFNAALRSFYERILGPALFRAGA
jgi:3-oxoadipate enol-lactonase